VIDVIYTSIPIEVEDNVRTMLVQACARSREQGMRGDDGCMPGLAIVILP
jgi:hypothetical protein